eukprot:7380053-Prymnesium_polylepis.1
MAALFAALGGAPRSSILAPAFVRAAGSCPSRSMHGQRPMHGSRTSAHEQGAAPQSRHSRRRHTVPGMLHGSRASSVPAQALGSSDRT